MLCRIFSKKINSVRRQNWSAPAIMSAFLLISMIIIFSFETLGLSNKDKNLEVRTFTPEKRIYKKIILIFYFLVFNR